MVEYSDLLTKLLRVKRSASYFGLSSSKNSLARPPHPTYLASSSCSSGLACRPSFSNLLTRSIAAIFVSIFSRFVLG